MKDLLEATTIPETNRNWTILCFLCDASYHSNGFVLLIEEYLEHKDGTQKTDARVSLRSQRFNTSQLKKSTF